ncbi:tRNA pseudouridine(38-40) synthase TruA [Butyrivibrio fibrisolvens]|jgi:tRNA pseudouridine38-40 synthase|uniref:tRNA pseudouridine synthase A n=1 Tax=Butyrivibrio fibrisolvens TaxID=831 RepID=A0A317G653_BUTFI|nr:tRNA pseudouridine(38-40) synthase TruA [Butyrivibrio fibrisolvens]PWT27752.1 tRNA pseudouridine synthase A [Butyrivibrio fibrisolvens]
MKRNFKMKIRYDGTRFQGWESQPGVEMTIEGKIENVLRRMLEDEMGEGALTSEKTSLKTLGKISGEDAADNNYNTALINAGMPVKVIASGRTDAGVHAIGQVANVHLDTDMTSADIQSYLNRYLPDDIAIEDLKDASERFHARYNALGKTYRYTCYYGDSKPVFDRKYVNVLDQEPDVRAMRQAAEYLIGTHDFKSFCANPRMRKSTVRCVDSIEIEKEGPYIRMYFHGNGFLQNMVRILSGTLLEVGFGRMTPERVGEVLEAKDRKLAGPTAKAQGLCLMEVDY